MVRFDLPKLLVSSLYSISIVLALPHQRSGKLHRKHTVNEPVLEPYNPATVFETYGSGIKHRLSRRADTTLADSAIAFVQSRLGYASNSTQVHAAYDGPTASYAYLTQHHRGVPIANAVANVVFNKERKVIAFGSSFVQHGQAASIVPSVSVRDAISSAEKALHGVHSSSLPDPTLEYFVKVNGALALTHVIQVRNASEGTWYEAFVDAHSGELLSITNFVTQATYRVLPITKQDLTEGCEDLTDPQDLTASPLGWHNDGTTIYNTTTGNNALSFNVIQANITVQSGPNLTFAFTHDPAQNPSVQSNLDAARVNAFYVTNMMHDISYRYGFTETAFNFQKNNFGLGGKGSDHVDVDVQAMGFNNALFTAQRDGINGILTLYIWEDTDPFRDGALENDIIVHEYTHGITNRLTGGGTARCLQTLESGGLGEGWSDAMAEWTEHASAEVKDYVLAAYVTNNPAGIRHYPYSTNATTNPLSYSSLATLNEVHDMGEVWANMLHNVYAALVAKYGFSQSAFTNPSGSEGNIVWLHLFMDALSIQPCNPTFVNARDAWIQADVTRYNGANQCLLWKTFASKGLGVSAANFTDDFTVPSGC